MKKLTISFLGRDCPGIVSAVSQILGQTGCNIIEVTQTILCGEFAAIFIVQAPENVTEESLHTQLALGLVDAKLDLSGEIGRDVRGFGENTAACLGKQGKRTGAKGKAKENGGVARNQKNRHHAQKAEAHHGKPHNGAASEAHQKGGFNSFLSRFCRSGIG